MKKCTCCGEEKPLDQFHRATKSKDGRQSRCKECGCRLAKEWNAKNKDRKNENERKRREENGEVINAARRARRVADPELAERQKQQHRESYWRNRDRAISYYRERSKTPEYRAAARERYARWIEQPGKRQQVTDSNRRRWYGMEPEDYEALLEAQGGACAICGGPPSGRGRFSEIFCVDHDHNTGVIRGLLCGPCNTAVGQMNDDPQRLRAAAAYLEADRSNMRVIPAENLAKIHWNRRRA